MRKPSLTALMQFHCLGQRGRSAALSFPRTRTKGPRGRCPQTRMSGSSTAHLVASTAPKCRDSKHLPTGGAGVASTGSEAAAEVVGGGGYTREQLRGPHQPPTSSSSSPLSSPHPSTRAFSQMAHFRHLLSPIVTPHCVPLPSLAADL